MATNANPYVVNIVPLQGIATGLTSSSDTAGQIITLQANVANIQTMVDYTTHTISADFITSFTKDQTIEITENINLSSASLYQNGVLINTGTVSSVQFATGSYMSGTTQKVSITTAGNNYLEVGNLPNVSSGVQVNGYLFVSNDAYVRNMYQTSDRNLKTDIKPFTTCLDEILKLEPCVFRWKETGNIDIGFIAQDVQASWPSLSEGTSIAYSRFVPLLLEGLRELHERVSTLEFSMKGLSKS
jgi:hypothetical protein